MTSINKISQYEYIVNPEKDWPKTYKALFQKSDICLYHNATDDEDIDLKLGDLAQEFPNETRALICEVAGEKGGGGGFDEFFTDLERTIIFGYLLLICKDFVSSFMKKLGEELASKLAKGIFNIRKNAKADKKFLLTIIRENGDEITYIFPKHLTENEIYAAFLALKAHFTTLSNERIYNKDFIFDTGKGDWLTF